jgi:hypothetical protein
MVGGAPVDYFAVAGSVKRIACSEHGNGFEQVGLALGIFSVEKKESRPERKIEMFVIAKVVQREVRKIHVLSVRCKYTTWSGKREESYQGGSPITLWEA